MLFDAVCFQHFFSFFKTLVGKKVIIELKNDLALRGTLHSVDQYLNIKLTDMEVVEPEKYPHLVRPDVGLVESSIFSRFVPYDVNFGHASGYGSFRYQ